MKGCLLRRTAGDFSSAHTCDSLAVEGDPGNGVSILEVDCGSLRRQPAFDAPDCDSVPLFAFRRVPTHPGGKLLPLDLLRAFYEIIVLMLIF